MDYDALMAFAVFARHRNFTRAAEELFISQPALHQKVSKLADQLEVRLYVRSGRDLVLTKEGERLARHAREVASLTDDVLATIHDDDERSPVVLASGPGAFLHLLGPAILEAQRGPHPLRLLTMRAPDAAAAVREARAQLAVGVFLPASQKGLELHPWREVGQMVVVPEDHRLAECDQLEPADLDGEALVIAPAKAGHQAHRVSTEQVLAEHDVEWSIGMEAAGWELMMRFVTYGMGITIINDFVPVPDGLVGIPVSGFPTVDYSIAMCPDTHHQGAKWLFDVLTDVG